MTVVSYRGNQPLSDAAIRLRIIACRAAQERACAAVAHSPNAHNVEWEQRVTDDLDRMLEQVPRPREARE